MAAEKVLSTFPPEKNTLKKINKIRYFDSSLTSQFSFLKPLNE